MQTKYGISMKSRRDALYDAYMQRATAESVDYRTARDLFSLAYSKVKHIAFPTEPHPDPERSTPEEREAYAREKASPTTQTAKARALDALMTQHIIHPEWLADALLKPRKPQADRKVDLETQLKRVFRRIAVLQDAEAHLLEAREERRLIEGKLALLAQQSRVDGVVEAAAAHAEAHGYDPAG